MYFMPQFDILGNFPVWLLALNYSSFCTNIKPFFFLLFGSWVGTEIASCIASVLSNYCIIFASFPRLDFIVVDLVPCWIYFM